MPSARPALTIILPAYNEVQRIAQTLDEIQAYCARRGWTHEIIVAADGQDGTRELVAQRAQTDPSLRVIGSARRRGKGYAIREAMKLARGEIVGFMDADNKNSIEEFDKLEPWLRAGYDLVIGSRGLSDSQVVRAQPFYRQVGSRGFGFFMHAVVGLPTIVDTQCGFKFFQSHVAKDLFARQTIDGYMFDVEILFLAQKLGYRIKEVPIRWADDGDSRLDLWRDNPRIVADVIRIRLMHSNLKVEPPIELPAPTPSQKWPKTLPALTDEQQRIRDDFYWVWLDELPRRYGVIERFNHGYPLGSASPARHRTLEIGAGVGEHLRYENLATQEYVALELREALARTISASHPTARVIVGDCQGGLPFANASFDRVLAIHVLEHLPNLPRAVDEVRRVLSPDGLLSVCFPCEGGLLYTLARNISTRPLFKRRYRQSYDWFIASEHINRPDEIIEELMRLFEVVHRRYFPLPLPSVNLNLVIGLTLRGRSGDTFRSGQ